MDQERLRDLLNSFAKLRLAVVGDFCLDRYLEIDSAHHELSIETGLPVYKVTRVRAQPGAAGTVLNNLVGLGVGTIFPVGFCGDDGEGYELSRALSSLPGIDLRHFLNTPQRRTFTYCKPLLLAPEQLPRELSRLDSKNWSATPECVSDTLANSVASLAGHVDAISVMDQVDIPETGVVTEGVRRELAQLAIEIPVLADSRSGLGLYPPLIFKLNRSELCALQPGTPLPSTTALQTALEAIADRNQCAAFVTLAEEGMLGALPGQKALSVRSLPVRGPIDIVGAGDSVTAALTAALAVGASLGEAMELAMLAASSTVHQLGTTGQARAEDLLEINRAFGSVA